MGAYIRGHIYSPDLLINGTIFVYILIIVWVIYIIRAILYKNINIKRTFTYFLFSIYICVLFITTLTPIGIFLPGNIVYKFGFGQQYLANFNIMDVFTDGKFQIAGNIIMLTPFVYFMAILNYKFTSLKNAILTAFIVSLTIETIQLIGEYFYFSDRIFDINDIILNTLGGFVGFVLYKITDRIFNKEIDSIRKEKIGDKTL